MHGKAKSLNSDQWAVVLGTHEPLISQELWETVQVQVAKNSRAPNFTQNVGLFSGFLKCGDCGRSMAKTLWNSKIHYSCGSYKRYGATACTKHYIPQSILEEIVLDDLNRIIAAVDNLKKITDDHQQDVSAVQPSAAEQKRLQAALSRIRRLKQGSYEDYRDKLISRDDFLRYKADYDHQEQVLLHQISQLQETEEIDAPTKPWIENLLQMGKLEELDRVTLAQTVKEIRVFEENRIEIQYLFSDTLRDVLENNTEEEIDIT
jgi:hypothetical protein